MSEIAPKFRRVYLIGIKGVGMTMLAQFLKEKGAVVSGSDNPDVFLTDAVLKKEKIKVYNHFDPQNIPSEATLIIHSSAYNAKNNVELAALAGRSGVTIMDYASALGQIFSSYQGIAVCGSHGKTTTSAWLGYVLAKAGLEPNVLVGSSVPQFKGSGLTGQSALFVAEADEYQNKLRYFQPFGVVLNNIDYDHPDFYKTKASYTKAFRDFVAKIPEEGFLVANNSDRLVRSLYPQVKGWILNYELAASRAAYLKKKGTVLFVAYDRHFAKGYQCFSVNDWGVFKIKLLGQHNIYNALAVIAAAYALGLEISEIKKYLASFTGTTRRAQPLGNFGPVPVFDDYAHHPTEVQATLTAFREAYPDKKLVAVFHPHTFTRTLALFDDFKKSFAAADELIVLNIYGSAREEQGGISSAELVAAIKSWNREQGRKQPVCLKKDLAAAEIYLRQHLQDGDLLLLMGAGDIFRLGDKLVAKSPV
jgi:UDP-N-acetylmuramate--alanine ligase